MGRFPTFVAEEEDSEPVSPQHRWHVWSSASAFRSCSARVGPPSSARVAVENEVIILAALTDIEPNRHRGAAYVGMSRTRATATDSSR
jgi:hypothetical protein